MNTRLPYLLLFQLWRYASDAYKLYGVGNNHNSFIKSYRNSPIHKPNSAGNIKQRTRALHTWNILLQMDCMILSPEDNETHQSPAS